MSAAGPHRRLLIAAFAVLSLAYLAQLPTPLRLHNDTVVLVSMGESAAHGGGFLYHGRPSHYPQGYPAMVALLLKLGAFHVWTAVALNFVFLALALWAAAKLVPHGVLIAFLTPLSFVVIKHATIPLTDLIFFGVAMLCLWALAGETPRPAVAFILVLAGIALRRNGIALAPPLVWVLWRGGRRWLAVAAVAAAGIAVRLTSTLQDFHDTVEGHGLIDSALQILGFRAREFGEIAANMPSIALPPAGQAILPWFGALVLLLTATGIWMRRRSFGPLEVFFLGYAAILFVWPYYDPRFWLPVLPLLFAYVSIPVERLVPKPALASYLALWSLLGVAVLAISIRITYAGPQFPDAYGNAQFRPTYCAFYGSCPADPKEVSADGLRLLRTYR